MNKLILLSLFAAAAFAQNVTRWAATTGDTSLSAAATTATIQQPASNGATVSIDQVVVYCSVACNVTQAANGSAATTTAGTVTPIVPSPGNSVISATFWTASNVGTGTAQGGITHIPAGSTVVLCLSPQCGNTGQVVLGLGTSANYSVTIASITGTVNITFYGRSIQ